MHRAIVTPERMERVKLAEMTFTALRAQQEYENKLLEMGFNWEYGEGPTGQFLEANKNTLIDTLYHLFGLTRTSYKVRTNLFGQEFPCTLDILYPEDDDIDFTISEDDFTEALYKAIDNEELSKLMVHTWVMKDTIARTELNNKLIPTEISPKVGAKSLLVRHGIMKGEE